MWDVAWWQQWSWNKRGSVWNIKKTKQNYTGSMKKANLLLVCRFLYKNYIISLHQQLWFHFFWFPVWFFVVFYGSSASHFITRVRVPLRKQRLDSEQQQQKKSMNEKEIIYNTLRRRMNAEKQKQQQKDKSKETTTTTRKPHHAFFVFVNKQK